MTPAQIKKLLMLAVALFSAAIFLMLTWELWEDSFFNHFDIAILKFFGKLRISKLNGPAVDITALGSATVSTLVWGASLSILLLAKKRTDAIFLFLTFISSGIGSIIIKLIIKRDRPSLLPHLVEVTDYSYPSGHTIISTTLFLSLALIASQYFNDYKSKILLLSIAAVFTCLVGLSRIYLGVHYPTDIVSGVLLGLSITLGVKIFLLKNIDM